MIELWEKLLDRPKWQRITLWVGVVAFLLYLFWTFSLSGLYTEMQTQAEKVESLDSQVAIETGKLKNLPNLKKELEVYNELNASALEMLPHKGQVEGLLDTVSSLARDSGLTVRIFTPRTESKKQFFSEIPIDLDMKGNFQQIEIFLDELSRVSRIVNVQDILIDNPRGFKDGGLVEVDVRAVLKTFRYLEESERPQPQGASKGNQSASSGTKK